MIVGIGTDLVEIARIERTVERHGERLALRVLAAGEMDEYRRSSAPARLLAKRFAVKEAAGKALGTGIGQGVTFRDFILTHDDLGRPELRFEGVAMERCRLLGMTRAHVTISDEQRHAVAFVVLEAD